MSGYASVAQMMQTTYCVPDLRGRRVLLAGLGGGCDIFTAYAFGRTIPDTGMARLVCANTKRRGACGPVSDRLSGHVYRSATVLAAANGPGGNLIESAPLIFVVPDPDDESEFIDEVRHLGFDFIFGIDAGGDSLAPTALSGPEGRDKHMLRLLRRIGVPVHHVVVAPGCDGESTPDALTLAMTQEAAGGHYLGCFSLAPMYAALRRFAAGLTSERTPCIMLAAAARIAAGDGEFLAVERGLWPQIPLAWLTHGFVFGDPGNEGIAR